MWWRDALAGGAMRMSGRSGSHLSVVECLAESSSWLSWEGVIAVVLTVCYAFVLTVIYNNLRAYGLNLSVYDNNFL